MGKTRGLKWGLFFALAFGVTGLLLHTFVINPRESAPAPAPSPAPEAGPLSGWRICLDPGHGGYDGGAYGTVSGVPEKELNLDVALRLSDLLRGEGAEVKLTRREDTALAGEGPERKRRDLRARVEAADGADLFLSIHMNKYRTATQTGPQVFYRKGQETSRLLAGTVQEAMNGGLSPARPRRANTGDYYVLRNLSIPAVLVECGFLSSPAEEARLLTPDYRQRLAEAIAAGVKEYAALDPSGRNAGEFDGERF